MQIIAVFGANGGLGQALIQEYFENNPEACVLAVGRGQCPEPLHNSLQAENFSIVEQTEDSEIEINPGRLIWFRNSLSEASLQALFATWAKADIQLSGVLSTIGWLHQENEQHGNWQPERRIESLNEAQLLEYFRVNAILPALILQHAKPLLPKKEPSFVIQLGAKVGSISDNHLGGWYGYRSSKAALNMLYKTAAIEFKRTHKQLCIGVIHPGTTDTELSKPFQERLPADKLYSAAESAERIWAVINGLSAKDTGGFWFWDGEPLLW
ncbi:short-chain dehydrogenase [Aliidiomarina iranensis]|uniref:Short-chain dehydrogenase n=1 Tax=Aliidiomarina iranensis TaxID=1434071 RepID=A0A432VWM4_9GAMM|nr:SDR family NAD(P)-dependent oxidoreductase [Aliidiomarina iranensis]RUO20955.1 short-chain dehydrogenase [Aliidiomarina iranensis]